MPLVSLLPPSREITLMRKWFGVVLGFMLLVLLAGCQEQRQAYADLKELLESTFAANGPGVVLVVDSPRIGEQILAIGQANLERGQQIRSTSHFRIGDMTKAFVSTLVFQLVESGQVGLDDPLPQHFPAEITANLPHAESITIRQLLNMSSGLADYAQNPEFVTAVATDPMREWQAEELLAYVYDLEPQGEPGAGFAYANTNYLLLQLLIEETLDDTLAENLRDRVLDKLTLDDTYLEIAEDIPVGYVPGYVLGADGRYQDTLSLGGARGLGDTGLISNALDLSKYAPALYGRAFTGENGRAASLATLPMGNGDAYGLGIMRRDTAWGPMWGHDNEGAGFAGEMWYLPDHEITLVLLSNGVSKAELAAFASKVLETVLGTQ